LLSRGLEKPRHETEGRLARAEAIAARVGHQQQRVRIAYAKAWTAYWWFEDFPVFNSVYDDVERLTAGSWVSSDFEQLLNLWSILLTAVATGQIEAVISRLADRTNELKANLERLATCKERPTTALHAKSFQCLVELLESLRDGDDAR